MDTREDFEIESGLYRPLVVPGHLGVNNRIVLREFIFRVRLETKCTKMYLLNELRTTYLRIVDLCYWYKSNSTSINDNNAEQLFKPNWMG